MDNHSQNHLPLISVLVPMYNVAKTIKRCVQSIRQQTYNNLEIVLLDDGSTDQTYQIAQTLATQDQRIKLLQKTNNQNISTTRNYLLDNYTGDYVIWVDADDVVHKKYVEQLYTTITSTNADLGICGFSLMFANLWLIRPHNPVIRIFEKEALYNNIILNHRVGFTLWNKIFKHELIKNVRFNESIKFGEDFAFVFDYLKQVNYAAYTNDKLYKYIVRPGSETTKKFSHKKISFVEYLQNLLLQEQTPYIKEALATWLAFTGVSLLFLAKQSKYNNLADLQLLRHVSRKHERTFNQNRHVKFIHRLVMFFGRKNLRNKKPKHSTI